MKVSILRLGHRFSRDKRISTHLALTARQFGASSIIYDVKAIDVKESVDSLTSLWGSGFKVEFTSSPMALIRDFPGKTVHLTMYGLPVWDMLDGLKRAQDMLVIVGGKKVPKDVYDIVDHNVAVGGQPHSEVAALAVFLDRLTDGDAVKKEFPGGKRVIPQERGKKVLEP